MECGEMNRPKFSNLKSVEEFNEYYWYKDELIKICRKLSLDTLGTKAELEERLRSYLQGIPTENKRKIGNSIRQHSSGKVHLDMRIIPDGFKFNNESREFFKDYFHVSKFSFTKEMAAAVRKAEETNNQTMTVRDLIDIYLGTVSINNESSQRTYQWNNFLKDFCQDDRTSQYKSKIKMASILWNIVRDKKGSKVYRTELLDEYRDMLSE